MAQLAPELLAQLTPDYPQPQDDTAQALQPAQVQIKERIGARNRIFLVYSISESGLELFGCI